MIEKYLTKRKVFLAGVSVLLVVSVMLTKRGQCVYPSICRNIFGNIVNIDLSTLSVALIGLTLVLTSFFLAKISSSVKKFWFSLTLLVFIIEFFLFLSLRNNIYGGSLNFPADIQWFLFVPIAYLLVTVMLCVNSCFRRTRMGI